MSIERLIIHIGSDKAGSTAIQECLQVNRDWYRTKGIMIPSTGLTKMAGHPTLFQNLDSHSMRRDLANEVRSESGDCTTALLSWEGVHFFDDEQQKELRSLLEVGFPGAEIVIVYYVRNQVDLIQSGVLQQIKQLNLSPFAVRSLNRPFEQLDAADRQHLINRKRLFNERIDAWLSTFPRAEMRARLYDRSRLINGDVIDDFHATIGLEGDEGFRRPFAFANASLTAEASIVLGELSSLIWNEEDRRRAVDVLVGYKGSGHYLFDDTHREMTRFYAADNRELVRRFPACDGIEEIKSRPGTPITDEALTACRAALVEQTAYPTLMEGQIAGRELDRLNLVEGWGRPSVQGSWTIESRSTFRFRPRGMHFGGFTPGLELNLEGKYAGRRRQTDHVWVNGTDLGPIDLTAGPFFIPSEILGPNYAIEVVLQHDLGRKLPRPGEAARSFHLRTLRYSVIQ